MRALIPCVDYRELFIHYEACTTERGGGENMISAEKLAAQRGPAVRPTPGERWLYKLYAISIVLLKSEQSQKARFGSPGLAIKAR